MAIILHIETATQACSVALSSGSDVLAIRESREKNIHSGMITIFIGEVLKEAGKDFAELEAIAVSQGPGSFTGLRIGVSTAKGLCYALEKPLIAVNTLHAMATGMARQLKLQNYQADQPMLLCPMIDARRMEVYNAVFDESLAQVRETRAEIIGPESFADFLNSYEVWFGGDGAEKCESVLKNSPHARFFTGFFPSSEYMIGIAAKKFERGEFEDVAYLEPFYLKDFIAGIPRVKGLR